MKSPTSDQYHYLLEKSIVLEIFKDISKCLIIENIMYLDGYCLNKLNFIVIVIYQNTQYCSKKIFFHRDVHECVYFP